MQQPRIKEVTVQTASGTTYVLAVNDRTARRTASWCVRLGEAEILYSDREHLIGWSGTLYRFSTNQLLLRQPDYASSLRTSPVVEMRSTYYAG